MKENIINNLSEIKQKYRDSNMPWSEAFEAFIKKYSYEDGYMLQMDGIIDKAKWDKYDTKILFVLKDSYREIDKNNGEIADKNYIYDLTYRWSTTNREKMRYTPKALCGWLDVFYDKLFDLSYPENNILHTAAMINLSKRASPTVRTQSGVMKYSVIHDSKELYLQFKEIAPKIVVYCNSGNYFFDILYRGETNNFTAKKIPSREVEEFKQKRLTLISTKDLPVQTENGTVNKINIYAYDNILIFHPYHPTARGKFKATKEDFEYLIELYKEQLLSILNK